MANNEYTLRNFYKNYKSHGGNLKEPVFRKIIKTFLKNAVDSLIEGNRLKLGYNLGLFEIVKIKRSFKHPVVNWGESNKYKQRLLDEGKPLYDKDTKEGFQWLIYYTDPLYYGFNWRKEKIKNIDYNMKLHNALFYELETFNKTSRKLAASINELSPLIYEFK